MIWQHKITRWKIHLIHTEDEIDLLFRQAEAMYDAIGAEGWELVTTRSSIIGNEEWVWSIWKRPFLEKAQAA